MKTKNIHLSPVVQIFKNEQGVAHQQVDGIYFAGQYAPLIDELPMALECKVKSYENRILIGEIVNVCADESVITDGKIDTKKLKPITFDPCNNTYIGLGEVVGKAFSDGMKLKFHLCKEVPNFKFVELNPKSIRAQRR